MPPALFLRDGGSTQQTTTSVKCIDIKNDQMVISRAAFIVAITISIAITCLSLLGLSFILYREAKRQKRNQDAKTQGRKSRYLHRISMLRKEVDDEYTRKFTGCLHTEPENPFLQPRSPVEMGFEERVCEVPALPPRSAVDVDRKGRARSMMFDVGKGLWFHRQ